MEAYTICSCQLGFDIVTVEKQRVIFGTGDFIRMRISGSIPITYIILIASGSTDLIERHNQNIPQISTSRTA